MDAHTTAVAEPTQEAPAADPVADLPAEETEAPSFADALESALANLGSEEQAADEPTAEVVEEPTTAPEEPAEETAEEPAAENVSEEQEAAEAEEGKDLLESLSEDIGDDWTPKAASRFKQLKEELKSNRSEVEQLRQTVKEQESKMQEMAGLVENKDIDALQQQVASYEQEKAFTDLESTQAYKQAVTTPLETLMRQTTEIADKWEIDADALIDAIAMDDAEAQDTALEDLLPAANDRDKAKIYRIIEDIGPILQRRENLIENAEAALQEARLLEEQRSAAEAAERAEERANITRNVVNRVSEKLPFLSGIENLDMGAIQEQAAGTDPTVVHPVDFAYNAVAAQLLPKIVREYLTSRKENEALTDRLAEYEDAEPTVGGTPAADGTRRASADLSFEESISAALGG